MLVGAIIGWILFGVITMMAAEKKGKNGCSWFIIGVLLGPFGFIIALLIDPVEDPSYTSPKRNDDRESIYLVSDKPKIISANALEEQIQQKDIEITSQTYSNEFFLGWPLQPLKSELAIADDKSFAELRILKIKNVTNERIKYSEWEITCFDILNRIINTEEPIILKIEQDIDSGKFLSFSYTLVLPKSTKSIQVRLLNTLFDSGRIAHFEEEPLRKIHYETKDIIEQFETDSQFLTQLKTYYNLQLQPNYLHEVNPEGYWICSFCGVANIPTSHECQCCGSVLTIQQHFQINNLTETYNRYHADQLALQQQREEERQLKEKQLALQQEKERQLAQQRQEEHLAQLKKKRKRKIFVIIIILIIIGVGFVLWETVLHDIVTYRLASVLLEKGEYLESTNKFLKVLKYKDSSQLANDAYLQYIEALVKNSNSDEKLLLVDAYDWLYTNDFEKEKIFLSIRNNIERMPKQNQEEILKWLDENDFNEFLPTITLVMKDEKVQEQVLQRLQQQSFLEGMLLANVIEIKRYGYKLVIQKNVNGNGFVVISPNEYFKSIYDETLFVHWEQLHIGDVGPAGGIICYDKGGITNNWRFIEVAPIETEWVVTSIPVESPSRSLQASPAVLVTNQPPSIRTIAEALPEVVGHLDTKNSLSLLVAELEFNGFNDWLLPSKYELMIIYNQLHQRGLGSFMNVKYWSSTKSDYKSTWVVDFSDGKVIPHDNNSSANVRAIRYF